MFLNFSCHKTTEENCQHLSFGIARKINPVSSPFKVSLESYPLITLRYVGNNGSEAFQKY